MKKLKMYCLCLHNKHFQTVKKLGYIPVGLGKGFFSPEWLRDNEGENISNKNEYYGEYTFHYWFWKNRIEQIENNTWIGFCAYRRFWLNKSTIISKPNKNDFLNLVLFQINSDQNKHAWHLYNLCSSIYPKMVFHLYYPIFYCFLSAHTVRQFDGYSME